MRGSAHEVVTLMGIDGAIAAASTREEGTRFVDGRGRPVGEFPASDAQDGPTAELEVLRGDLARIIRDALPPSVRIRYGDAVESVREQDRVHVRFRSGLAEEYDLLVIEGVRSGTRDAGFGGAVVKKALGVTVACGAIPRAPQDDRWWRWMVATRGRHVTLRPDGEGTTRATLALLNGRRDLRSMPLAQALQHFEQEFRGGGGTALALTGGYVLAAFLSQAGPDGWAGAFHRYEAWLRPLVEETQELPPGLPRLAYPRSRAGVAVLRTLTRIGGSKPLRKASGRLAAVGDARRPLPAVAQPGPAETDRAG
ncbi:hypothetical protein [Kineococcus vitellinus]|uniref:hypothetical protein n=1 Tax=Kineococcus vitellinus TaxID=2696565 RepID=UPI00196A8F62|nr:hypothetical protein [Kineococcus vitellinus]